MWNLLLIPSVYGALVWVGLLSLMTFDLVPLNITSEATSVFLYVVLCFLVSSAAFFRDYAAVNILKFGVSIKSDGLDRFSSGFLPSSDFLGCIFISLIFQVILVDWLDFSRFSFPIRWRFGRSRQRLCHSDFRCRILVGFPSFIVWPIWCLAMLGCARIFFC